MIKISRGQAESMVTEAIIKFEREYMGRGPMEAKTFIFDDQIFIRLRGVLTPAEKQLAQSDTSAQGRSLIKQVRRELIEKARPLLEAIVKDILGLRVKSLHTDISSRHGEKIIVFSLESTPIFDKE